MSKLLVGVVVALAGVVAANLLHGTSKRSKSSTEPALITQSNLPEGEWRSLFNGRDLEGWYQIGGGKCSVQDGLLVVENDEHRWPGYLISTATAKDLRARVRCKVIRGDSGFFFRSRRDRQSSIEITGPQVQLNLEPGAGLGGLFEIHGRGWIRRVPQALNDQLLKDLDWIDLEVHARGDRVSVAINGTTTVDLEDGPPANQFREAGFFAWQIHGGAPCKVLVKEISVLNLE